jgi:hypothetical protein
VKWILPSETKDKTKIDKYINNHMPQIERVKSEKEKNKRFSGW